jgi:hypothetical protein
MTQINKDNWAEEFPEFLARTQDPNLSFVAFDLEMTGAAREGYFKPFLVHSSLP